MTTINDRNSVLYNSVEFLDTTGRRQCVFGYHIFANYGYHSDISSIAGGTMRIETRTAKGVTVVEIHGRLTVDHGATEVRDAIRELLHRGQNNILLNLGGVSYVDSIGVGSLVVCHTTVLNRGGQLKFSNLTEKTRHLLEITKLLNVFDSFEDERLAIAAFS